MMKTPCKIIRQAALCLALFCISVLSPMAVVMAATGPWQGMELPEEGQIFRARLISATDGVGGNGDGASSGLMAGLEFELAPGWKVYWRDPGDAGLPPELDFGKGSGVAEHRLEFPAPLRFSILGLDSYGYKDHVILPLMLYPENPGQALAAKAALEGLVCRDICIPVSETLTLDVPQGDAAPSPHARRIAEARALVPSAGTAAGMRLDGIAAAAESLALDFTRGGREIGYFTGDIFVEGAGSGYGFAAPRWSGGRAHIAVSGKPAASLIGKALTITAVGGDFLLEARAEVAPVPAAREGGALRLLAVFGIAFLGGVILNVMPCVLPVLSLKLSRVLGGGNTSRRRLRLSFLVTAAGVIVSFLVLGGGLLLARQAGAVIGWGVQFQQPLFLAIAAGAIALFGLILLDRISLPVPQFAARLAMQMRGSTGGENHGSLGGDFAAGALATLLATPCSAPFVGTAVAFALTTTPPVMLAVFAVMGLGLALPWILVAAWPGLIAFLPKPGPWLAWLKRVLAIGLFATALWLGGVLAVQLGITGGGGAGKGDWMEWQPGLAEKITRDEARPVLVDVTADWCITCKTNKALVIETDTMLAHMAAANVALVQADWTRPDARISAYLAGYGRYGIPFNIVHGPGAPEGIVLPEILTARILRDALARAAGK